MAENLTLDPPCKPPLFDATPTSLVEDAIRLIKERTELIDRLTQIEDPTFDKAILPFIQHENTFIRERRLITFYAGESPHPEVRDASREASKLFSQADIELFARRDFYELVKTTQQENLDLEFARYLELKIEDFEESGLTITDPRKLAQFKDTQVKLSNLRIELLKRINEDVSGSWFTRQELQGLPEAFLESHIKTREDDSDPERNIWISAKESDTVPFFQKVIKSQTRKTHYLVCQNRGMQNISLYRDLFLLKDRSAKLLGYPNYAALRTNYQTLKSTEKVLDFLSGVESRLKPKGDEYLSELLKLKTTQLAEQREDNDHPDYIFSWESAYLGRIYKEQLCDYDDNVVTEYFSLQYSMKQLFKLYEDLFGVFIKEHPTSQGEVLHKNASLYSLWDKDDNYTFIGYLYIDPYPRPGRYNHFGHFGLLPVGIDYMHCFLLLLINL
jgi:metallopeptidase MepB